MKISPPGRLAIDSCHCLLGETGRMCVRRVEQALKLEHLTLMIDARTRSSSTVSPGNVSGRDDGFPGRYLTRHAACALYGRAPPTSQHLDRSVCGDSGEIPRVTAALLNPTYPSDGFKDFSPGV